MINQTNNPVFAVTCLLKGLKWLSQASLRKYLLIPILVNLVIYSCLLGLGYFYLNDAITYLIPTWLHWLSWLLWPLFFICFVVVGFFTFTMLANLIASPFYGKLAKKTWQLIVENNSLENEEETDVEFELTEPNWLKVMLGELGRIAYLLKWMVLLVIISIIPGLNLISPLLWAIFGAWGCALEFFAYPLENKGLLFSEQKDLTASVRLGTLSFGGLTLAGLSLPVFNLLVAPIAVIAATCYVYEIDAEKKQKNQAQ
jgi:CysZ protein